MAVEDYQSLGVCEEKDTAIPVEFALTEDLASHRGGVRQSVLKLRVAGLRTLICLASGAIELESWSGQALWACLRIPLRRRRRKAKTPSLRGLGSLLNVFI